MPNGAFLIRNKQKHPNVREPSKENPFLSPFSLSVKNAYSEIVQHYLIKKSEEGLFFLYPKDTFDSLNQLVTHYTSNSLPHGSELVPVDLGYRSPSRDISTKLGECFILDTNTDQLVM